MRRDGSLGDVYDYDLSDQVITTKLNIANPDSTAPGPATIVYDANGNRKSFSAYGPTDTYGAANNLNEYTTRNGVSAVYDGKGNMTTGFNGSTYTYDAQNRLLSATKSGTTDTFLYDGLNRQVSRKVSGSPLIYNVYDGWDLLGEYQNGSTTASSVYLHGPTGVIKNLVTNNYYYQDASGSTSHLTNSSGTLIESYRYDLHGTPIFYNSLNQQLSTSNYGVRHLFTGQQWYSELGLYDLRNRYYSPDIGRFLQADPAGFGGDATNLYRYCGNNPLRGWDPSGLTAQAQDPGHGGFDAGPGSTPPRDPNEIVVTGDPVISNNSPIGPQLGSNPFAGNGNNPFGLGNGVISLPGAAGLQLGGFLFNFNGGGGPSGFEPIDLNITTGVSPSAPRSVPSSLPSPSLTDYVEAALDAVVLTTNYITGGGPEAVAFGPDSVEARMMADAPAVQQAIAAYADKNAGVTDWTQQTPVDNFRAGFGLSGAASAGMNATRQFTGSYTVTVYPTGQGQIGITTWNNSSFQSLSYGQGPSWSRSSFAPGGNMYQTITWTRPYP